DAARPGERELPHIAWLLAALSDDTRARDAADGAHEGLSERQRFEILWECRFALNRTRRSTAIPLEVVERIFADVEQLFRAEDVSPNLYAKYRALLARDVEAPEVLEQWLEIWRESPRDELSDCEVCDVAADARFLGAAGDYDAALDRAADLLEGRVRCDVEPHRLYGEAADWAMRLGRADTAEAYHRTGWLMVDGNPRFVSAMADHVMYLLRANRPGRGVRLAQSMIPVLAAHNGERLDDDDRMRGAAVAGRVLRAGRGHRFAPSVVAGLPLDTAIANFEGIGRQLATAFDVRNGTKRVSERLAALTRISRYPELASEEARTIDLLEVALTPARPEPRESESPLPQSALGYAAELLAASDAFAAVRVMQLVNGWAAHRDELLPVDDPLEHFSVSYLDRRALVSERAQFDDAFVQTLLASAAESARLSGSRPAVQRVEVEVLHRAALAGDASAWSRAEKIVEELAAIGELRESAAALMTLSRNPDARRGMGYALRSADMFERADQPRWQVTALQAAGYAAVWADPKRAGELLERARALAVERQLPSVAVAVQATQAKLAWREGDLEAAAAGYRAAVEASSEVGVTDPLALRSELCDVLLQAGHWEELIDEAHELLVRLDDGDLIGRALAHRVLGLGLLETGNVHESVEVLDPAAVALAREQEPLYAVTSWTLGRAYLVGGRADLAAGHFETAATGFEEQERLPDAAAAHEAAGATLGQSGETVSAAEHLVAAARMSRYLGDVHRMVSALRQLAGVQAAAGRVNEALSTLGSIIPEARSVTVPDGPRRPGTSEPIAEDRLRGLLEHQAALVLIDGGREDEAPQLLEDAIGLLTTYGEPREVAAAQESWRRLTGSSWPG
ncbi:MAG: Tetratricopeptide 4, partial [Nocardioidaceae bacterium]|nr:Tetratricopeptide 4 [Nocardioidaceae bacterium]